MHDSAPTSDLTRTTVGVLFLVTLAGASLWIMRPFLLPLVWATTIVIATWPVLLTAQRRLGDRRWLATVVMVGVLLGVFLVPASAAVAVVIANGDRIAGLAADLRTLELPDLPDWIAGLPVVGDALAEGWAELAAAGPDGLGARLQPYATDLLGWLLGQLRQFGLLLIDFVLTTVLAAILYLRGEVAAAAVGSFAARLAGPRGAEAAVLAGQAIRSVALGVVVTALTQAVVGGIGLLLTGVPVPGLLMAVMFLLGVAQIGAAPVLFAAAAWLFATDSSGAGVVLSVWALVVGSLDNLLRPFLIRRGVELPLLLIFAGVIGGLIAFGVIGIFVGPVLLAVTWTLLAAWIRSVPVPATAA